MTAVRSMTRRSRRGNYATIGALSVPMVFGFGALAVDVSWLKMAQLQSQDLADAATQAALITLRQTGDTDEATLAAQEVVARNSIAGGEATLLEIEYGGWDEANRAFAPSLDGPNAVRAKVGRTDADGVPFLLARIWGYEKADVVGSSVSAARALHVILAIDITNSWDLRNFDHARNASLTFLDVLTESYGEDDRIGMVVFTGRYGVEHTPMTLVSEAAATGTVETQWNNLNTASKSGRPNATPLNTRCIQHVPLNTWTGPAIHAGDAASHPAGGCFPGMWREYSDETGTDHSVALDMAEQMFDAEPDDGAYRALVMLTDGIPNGIAAAHGNIRQGAGYVDPLNHVLGPRPHTTAQIQADSITKAHDLYDDMGVSTWVVSFVQNAAFLDTMTNQGDGYYELITAAEGAAAIVPVFQDIAESLPLAIVE